MAVFALREALTSVGERGAALMEAVGVMVGGLEKGFIALVSPVFITVASVARERPLPFRYDS